MIRFALLSKLSKTLLIAQVAGAGLVLAGSVTYVAPYNDIWSLLGRVLLLPGFVVAFLIRPDRTDHFQGLLYNLIYSAVAVVFNTGPYLLALRLRESKRSRRQEQ